MNRDCRLAAEGAAFMPSNRCAASTRTQTTRWQYGGLACAYIALAVLGGCASINVTQQPIDSPPPTAELGEKPVYCLDLAAQAARNRKDAKLEENKSCWFVVQADAPENATGLKLDPHLTYEVTIPKGQFWFDAERRVPAPEGDNGTWFTRTFFTLIKQRPDLPWFALMASPCGDKSKSQHVVARTDEKGNNSNPSVKVFDGELCFYVNDVPYRYGNNEGRIWILVKNKLNDAG